MKLLLPKDGTKPIPRWFWIGLLGVAFAVFWVYLFDRGSQIQNDEQGRAVPKRVLDGDVQSKGLKADVRNDKDPEIMERFLAIESEKRHLDERLWAHDRQAERHEDLFIRLWDLMRESGDALAVLGQFPVGEFGFQEVRFARILDNDIKCYQGKGDVHTIRQADWGGFVASWKERGYQIEQSEWRHYHFVPASDQQGASSVFRMRLDVTARPRQRYTLTGDLHVDWHPMAKDPEQKVYPKSIRVEGLEIRGLAQGTSFVRVFEQEIRASQEPSYIDPLIVQDLDGDNLPEIILGAKNRVYWNRGEGVIESDTLLTNPPEQSITSALYDVTGDGLKDWLSVDRRSLRVYAVDESGRFGSEPIITPIKAVHPLALTAGDIDQDGDLDLWLIQYKAPYAGGQMPTPYYDANDGLPSYLLLNDGNGRFDDGTVSAGLATKRFRRSYSASFIDLDQDEDLDLINVSDFAGVDIYINRGDGVFEDRTSDQRASAVKAFGMAHTFGDYNADGHWDVFVIGMNSWVAERHEGLAAGPKDGFQKHLEERANMAYGNRFFWGGQKGLIPAEFERDRDHTGWSWGASSFDFDNDADLDVMIVNGHKSRQTAKDYDLQFWRHDIYSGSSDEDPAWDIYFKSVGMRLTGMGHSYGGYEKNRLLLNDGKGHFDEIGYLAGVGLEVDCRNLVSADLDADGLMDLVLTTSSVWPRGRQSLVVLQNASDTKGHWIGVHLRQRIGGVSVLNAEIRLEASDLSQSRRIVSGDSHRSQHPTTTHFGLGPVEHVERIRVLWEDGQETTLLTPEIDRYHVVEAPERTSTR